MVRIGLAFLVLVALPLVADEKPAPEFSKHVLPVLRSRCVRCHGPAKQESRLRLDNLSIDLVNNRSALETWHEVLNVLNAGEMPPKDAPQLTKTERAVLTRWVSAAVKRALAARRRTDGRVVLRKLNRFEYQNTMSDLLGLDMDFSRDLPPDAVSKDGFRNDGRSLRMSALQLEYYLQTARRALDRIIVSGPAPKRHKYLFEKSNVKNWLGNPPRSNRLGRYQVFLGKMPKEYPEQGAFRLRVKLAAELKANKGFPILEVGVGYRPDTKILFREFAPVEITSAAEQTLEFRGRIENFPLPVRGQGKFPGLVVRLRNIYDDGSARQRKKPKQKYPDEDHLPKLLIKSVEFEGPIYDTWPPRSHRRILFDSPLRAKDENAYVAKVLERFMSRAYRRPARPDEVRALVAFYRAIRPGFPAFEDAIRESLAMILIRPDFLYLLEPSGDTRRAATSWELASRLSYFLWSTMPDDQLVALARSGKLSRPEVLAAQVDRMLADDRSRRFSEQFTEQWLNLNVVDRVAVNRKRYPQFDDRLKPDMRGETHAFFAELVRHNLSALNLLSSEFSMLNEPLARHYGIPNVYGRRFRRVTWKPGQHRGGLLGHAGVLLSNSTGIDSHPIRRAVWIRDRLLNDPPAPPPPDVPSLDEADPKFHKLSIREQLRVHRKREACARCHRDIDPWGIALENYDAVGLWREKMPGKKGRKGRPVDATAVLPDGQPLDGADRLREYLLHNRKDQFARGLVVRLTTYALGRRLELSDQPAIDTLTRQFAEDKYRLRGLIQKVVTSPLFLTK